MQYIIALDQGTSSTRAMLYSVEGELIHSSQRQLAQSYPKPGWVEQDPEQIWANSLAVLTELRSKATAGPILALGLTNQRETTLLWDKQSGRCLYPAIVWQDRRTERYCQGLIQDSEWIHQKTGLFPDPYFSASKLRWLLDSVPEAKTLLAEDRLAFGTVDSYLIWRLSGAKAHVTDVSNASRTLLLHLQSQAWDPELLAYFSIPTAILPQVLDSDAHFADVDAAILGQSVPITGVAGDQQAALLGQACIRPGMIKASYGTGGFLMMNTGTEPVFSQHRLLTTIAYRLQGQTYYALEGSLYHAGSIVKWLQETLKIIRTAAETESLAQQLQSNEGVYLIPAFTGLGAPHWCKQAGAMVVGLSQASGPAHFARAALESVCYLTRDVLSAMQEDAKRALSLLRVDGGMVANSWFLQALANQTGLEVQKTSQIESTVLGAAYLAALGAGLYPSLAAVEKKWSCERSFIPEKDERLEQEYQSWTRLLAKFTS